MCAVARCAACRPCRPEMTHGTLLSPSVGFLGTSASNWVSGFLSLGFILGFELRAQGLGFQLGFKASGRRVYGLSFDSRIRCSKLRFMIVSEPWVKKYGCRIKG